MYMRLDSRSLGPLLALRWPGVDFLFFWTKEVSDWPVFEFLAESKRFIIELLLTIPLCNWTEFFRCFRSFWLEYIGLSLIESYAVSPSSVVIMSSFRSYSHLLSRLTRKSAEGLDTKRLKTFLYCDLWPREELLALSLIWGLWVKIFLFICSC